jgi:hypothetical protein
MRKPEVTLKKLCDYFGIRSRTAHKVKKYINLIKLYKTFHRCRTIGEQKYILYSYKGKVKEDILDYIWEHYIERIYKEREKINEQEYIQAKRRELYEYQLSN